MLRRAQIKTFHDLLISGSSKLGREVARTEHLAIDAACRTRIGLGGGPPDCIRNEVFQRLHGGVALKQEIKDLPSVADEACAGLPAGATARSFAVPFAVEILIGV
jgi:hypothetical protein